MRISVMLVLAFLPQLLVGAAAQPADQTTPVPSSQLARAYRGVFVCEKQPAAADILHVSADLAIRGDQVQFGRPAFNLRGTRVVGSELGSGSVDHQGIVKITSSWSFRGINIRGAYEGTLTSSGGVLSGTQNWRGPDGASRSRSCQIAFVTPDT